MSASGKEPLIDSGSPASDEPSDAVRVDMLPNMVLQNDENEVKEIAAVAAPRPDVPPNQQPPMRADSAPESPEFFDIQNSRPRSAPKFKGLSRLASTKQVRPSPAKTSTSAPREEISKEDTAAEEGGSCSWCLTACSCSVNGKGSVLKPVVHCMAEQICLYDRESKKWCWNGKFGFAKSIKNWLHDGKRWKWESWTVLFYFLFLGLEAVMAWQLLKSRVGNSNLKDWMSDPSVSWGLVTMAYIALAAGGFIPVMHSVLKPGDYSKIGKADIVFKKDRDMIVRTCKRRVWEQYNAAASGVSIDDIEKFANDFADQCVAVRTGLEGALVTWGKWVSTFLSFILRTRG